MSEEKENALSIFGGGKLAIKHPRQQLDSIVRFHNEFYSFFKVDEFLKMLNEKFFDNKGELLPINNFYGLEPKINTNGVSESRFNKYFTLEANLEYSDLKATLRVKGENLLGNKKDLHWLDVSIYSEVMLETNVFNVIAYGEIYIKSGGRSSDGSWNQKAIFLSQVGESRISEFSLSEPVHPEEIAAGLFRNTSEILQGFAAQGFIKLPEQNPKGDGGSTNASGS